MGTPVGWSREKQRVAGMAKARAVPSSKVLNSEDFAARARGRRTDSRQALAPPWSSAGEARGGACSNWPELIDLDAGLMQA
jgi:hypothetical protein